MISSENGLLRGTVLLNVRGRDVGSFVDETKPKLASQVQLPPGYYMDWSGQYENQQRARQRYHYCTLHAFRHFSSHFGIP